MPIYEYRCAGCGHHLDVLQKMTDAPLRKCPDCGKSQLKRLMSAPQFRLKGSGWYETDFKSDKEKKRNLVEAGGEASAASAEGGAEAAPKPEGDKAVAEAKTDGGDKAAKPKPAQVKTKTPAAKRLAKQRASKSARA
jgi:putative FmdB family regulatory protein